MHIYNLLTTTRRCPKIGEFDATGYSAGYNVESNGRVGEDEWISWSLTSRSCLPSNDRKCLSRLLLWHAIVIHLP